MPPETVRHAAIRLGVSALIGFLIPTTGSSIALALTAVVPALWLAQRHREWAYGSACAYYACAIWPVISVVHGFNGSWTFGTAIWIGATLLLSMPWLIFRARFRTGALWCGPGATLLSVLPPLGFISVACPLSGAGVLFPGLKIVGLFAALILPGLIVWRPAPTLMITTVISAGANLQYAIKPPHQIAWDGVDTTSDLFAPELGDYGRIQTILDRADASASKVILFPEATIRSWTSTSLLFFTERVTRLRTEGKTIVVGAIISGGSSDLPYRNVLLQLGATSALVDQRVPVPLGMWHPFGRNGVLLKPYGNGIMRVGNERAAVLVCYEQLIAWPAIVSTFSEPDIAIGISSDRLVSGTAVPAVKSAYLHAWAKLWHAPLVAAAAR
jgi:hypothetical protein